MQQFGLENNLCCIPHHSLSCTAHLGLYHRYLGAKTLAARKFWSPTPKTNLWWPCRSKHLNILENATAFHNITENTTKLQKTLKCCSVFCNVVLFCEMLCFPKCCIVLTFRATVQIPLNHLNINHLARLSLICACLWIIWCRRLCANYHQWRTSTSWKAMQRVTSAFTTQRKLNLSVTLEQSYRKSTAGSLRFFQVRFIISFF